MSWVELRAILSGQSPLLLTNLYFPILLPLNPAVPPLPSWITLKKIPALVPIYL
jgi:hypothetical protein